MPYIASKKRQELAVRFPHTAGELNYVITQTLIDYCTNKGVAYRTINDIVGALECAKLEFTRRVVSPYEDRKCRENGDVYE